MCSRHGNQCIHLYSQKREHTFGLQALAPPLWCRRARKGLQLRRKDDWNDEALKLLSGTLPFSSPKGREQPAHPHTHKTYRLSHFSLSPSTKKKVESTHCSDRIPAAPVGERVSACSRVDESWCSEPLMVERNCFPLSWSCPGCHETSAAQLE